MGYDFYSFYLQVKNLGRWKNITLGRYRLNAGLGLILNNDFGFGKLSALTSLGRSSSCIIRGHSSRSSANYLQGAAATYTLLKGLELTGFLSYRQIDATLSADGGGIKTILKTGLHRTVNEIAKQKVASNTLVGGNICYRHQGWHIGGTAFYTSFSLPLTPNKSQLYKRFCSRGECLLECQHQLWLHLPSPHPLRRNGYGRLRFHSHAQCSLLSLFRPFHAHGSSQVLFCPILFSLQQQLFRGERCAG